MRDLASAVFRTMTIRGAVALGGIAWTILISREFGPAILGEFFLAFTTVLAVQVISRAGADLGLMRFVGREDAVAVHRTLFALAMKTTVAVSTVGMFAVVLLRDHIAMVFNAPNLSVFLLGMGLGIVPFSVNSMVSSFLKARARPAVASLFDSGGVLLVSALVFVLLRQSVSQASVTIVAWSFSSGAAILALVGMHLSKIRDAAPKATIPGDTAAVVAEFRASRPIHLATEAVVYIQPIIGTWIAGVLLSGDSLGLLKGTERLAMLMGFALAVANSVVAPSIASDYYNKKMTSFRGNARKSTFLAVAMALPAFLLFVSFPTLPLRLLGPEFELARIVLVILAIAQMINVACGPVMLILNMTGYARTARNVAIVWSALGLIGIWQLAQLFGISGAALAIGISMVGQNLTAAWYVRKHHGFTVWTPAMSRSSRRDD